MKIRIKFRKWSSMKFIGHLDMMRYFQKAVRRANISIRYSEGFSPHQIMSFAAPLGVGITSDGEYFDIEVTESMTSQEALAAFNNTMVDGVEVTGYVALPDSAKNAMSIVTAADYTLTFKEGYKTPAIEGTWEDLLVKEFHSQASFTVTKKTKKSEKEMDLKPLVYKFESIEANDTVQFHLLVSTGSNDNIKPEFVLASLFEKCNLMYQEEAIQIHRNEVYTTSEDGTFIPLLDLGEEIV